MIREGPDWQSLQTHQDRHPRIFSPLGEVPIIAFIRANFIDPGLILTDSEFSEIAINAFLQSHAGSDEARPLFQCSPEFIASFKTRHRLSLGKIHDKRRPTATNEQRTDWLGRIRILMETVAPSRIINCDETSSPLLPKGILT
jgi:hypothetical protein